MRRTGHFIKEKIRNTSTKRKWFCLFFVLFCVFVCYWSWHNENFYTSPIAKVTNVTKSKGDSTLGNFGEKEVYYDQKLSLVIMNGKHKGEKYSIKNTYAASQVKSIQYKVNDRVFVSFYKIKGIQKISIRYMKRDGYLVTAFMLLVFLLVFFVGKRGFRILVSMLGNAILFMVSVWLYTKGFSLWGLTAVLMVSLSVATLFLCSANENKRKTVTTAVATVITILIVACIYRIIVAFTPEIPYYMIEYLTYPHATMRGLFMVSVLFGSLGAVMDVAVTICSAVYEIIEVKPDISQKDLILSLQAMGKDIMGTMQNVLLFTYLVGAFPMMILMMKSGYMITNLLKYDFSFEVARFLTGAIGIVLAVPVAGIVSVISFHGTKIHFRKILH